METLKNILAFYPLYVVALAFLGRIIANDVLLGGLFGIVSYPLGWFIFAIMSGAGENGNESSISKRENDNGR